MKVDKNDMVWISDVKTMDDVYDFWSQGNPPYITTKEDFIKEAIMIINTIYQDRHDAYIKTKYKK